MCKFRICVYVNSLLLFFLQSLALYIVLLRVWLFWKCACVVFFFFSVVIGKQQMFHLNISLSASVCKWLNVFCWWIELFGVYECVQCAKSAHSLKHRPNAMRMASNNSRVFFFTIRPCPNTLKIPNLYCNGQIFVRIPFWNCRIFLLGCCVCVFFFFAKTKCVQRLCEIWKCL